MKPVRHLALWAAAALLAGCLAEEEFVANEGEGPYSAWSVYQDTVSMRELGVPLPDPGPGGPAQAAGLR